MYSRRDVEWKTSLPRTRLCVSSSPSRLSNVTEWQSPIRTDHHQLTLILGVLGTPSLEDFYQINSQRSRDYLRALPFQKKKPLQTLYPNANPLAIDLLERCLTFNPKKRSTVESALAHRE